MNANEKRYAILAQEAAEMWAAIAMKYRKLIIDDPANPYDRRECLRHCAMASERARTESRIARGWMGMDVEEAI